MRRHTIGEEVFHVCNVVFMLALMLVTLYPFLYTLFASFSNAYEFMSHTGLLLKPVGFTLDSYKFVMKNNMIFIGLKNTVLVLAGRLILGMLLTIIGAYFMSCRTARLSPVFSLAVVITMFFSGGLIPSYLNVQSFGLDNTLWALILPVTVNTFNMIITRNALEAIPDGLVEAARIDGAGHIRILFRILVPMIIPTLAVVTLYYSVETWNSWFTAMIYLRKKTLYPLQLVLREILILNNVGIMASGGDNEAIAETVQYAVMIVATVPILLVYPFLQKYFVKGVMVGAVKG